MKAYINHCFKWRPQGDSNPCYRRERASQVLVFILFIFLLCRSCAVSAEEYPVLDTSLMVASTSLILVDWAQTRYMARNYRSRADGFVYYETNPIMQTLFGEEPTPRQVDGYFLAALGFHAFMNVQLKGDARRFYNLTLISLQLYAVHGNYRLGLKARF